MSVVSLRPLRPGEYAEARVVDSEFDDFGPRPGFDHPPACRLDDKGNLAIVRDGTLVGTVSWIWMQWGPSAGSRCPMIGIYLDSSARGMGVGTEAQRQLVDLMFRHTASNRVEAHTDVENIAERRSLEKAGFIREGVVRGAQWRNGAYHDGYLYSILREDWKALSAG